MITSQRKSLRNGCQLAIQLLWLVLSLSFYLPLVVVADGLEAPTSFCTGDSISLHPVEIHDRDQQLQFINHTVYPLQWRFYRVPGADLDAGFYRFLHVDIVPDFFLSKPALFVRLNETPSLENFTAASYAIAGRVYFTLSNPEFRSAPYWCFGVYGSQPPTQEQLDEQERHSKDPNDHITDPMQKFITYNITFSIRDAENVLTFSRNWGIALILSLGTATGLLSGRILWQVQKAKSCE